MFIFVYAAAAVTFIPGSILTLSAGALFGVVKAAAQVSIGSTTTAQKILYGVGLLATLVVTVWITRIAKRAISAKLETDHSKKTAADAHT